MKKSLLFGAGRGPRLAVLEQIKRSGEGVSVKELATSLGMSYMGVKAHCLALSESGHLITRRRPSSSTCKGRPRLLYKLSKLGEELFASSENQFALDLLKEAIGLYGVTAPQKLLIMYFRSLKSRYSLLINAEAPPEWPGALVRLRDAEGRMSVLLRSECWEICESHNPLEQIMMEYPEACAMEEHMISEVLGQSVRRKEEGGKVIFQPARN